MGFRRDGIYAVHFTVRTITMHERTRIHCWALQAQAIANLHTNHHFRQKLMLALYKQLKEYRHINRPLWLETLIDLLAFALEHTDVRNHLYLFVATAEHIAQVPTEYAHTINQIYDPDGNPIQPTDGDPFSNFINNLNPDDDIPL